MTSHPPEPSPPRPPPPEERPAGHGQRPGEWRAFERPPRDQWDQPVNGHRAAAGHRRDAMPPPRTDYPPETGYEHAPDHPSLAGSSPDGHRSYPAAPGYPDMPDYPRDAYSPAGYSPRPDYPHMPDYPSMPDYPPMDFRQPPDHPRAPGRQVPPGYQATQYVPDGYPTANGYPPNGYPPEVYLGSRPQEGAPVTHEEYLHPAGGPVTHEEYLHPAGGPVTHEEYLHPAGGPGSGTDALQARPAPAGAVLAGTVPAGTIPAGTAPAGMPLAGVAPAGAIPSSAIPAGAVPAGAVPAGLAPGGDAAQARVTGTEGAQWAMLAYLTVPFFGFLMPLGVYLMFMRKSGWVRAHAAQSINVWLTGLMYALSAAIIGAMLWLITLAFLVRAAGKASRGETYTFPRWLCTPMVR